MKKILCLLTLVVALCTISSCSKSGEDFYQYVSDNSTVVVTLDPKSVLQNAGFQMTSDGIQMPEYLKGMFRGSERDEIEKVLNIKGIDHNSVMLVYDADCAIKSGIYLMARLTDAASFGNFLVENDFENSQEGGYELYTKGSNNIVVDGDVMLFFSQRSDVVEAVDNLKKDAASKPLAAWKKDKLDEDESGIFLVKVSGLMDLVAEFSRNDPQDLGIDGFADIMNGYILYETDLKGLELKMETTLYSEDGKHLKTPYTSGKIDKSLLKYSSPEDFVALLYALPEDGSWRQLIFNMVQREAGKNGAEIIEPFLDLIDGKMMASFGYQRVQNLMRDQEFHFAFTLQATKDQGAALLSQICSLLNDSGMPFSHTGNTVEISLGWNSPTIYIVQDGDNVVVSTAADPASGDKCKLSSGAFGDGCAGFVLQIPSNAPNITFMSLPFGIDVVATADDDGGELSVRLTDTDGYFLENILKIVTNYL